MSERRYTVSEIDSMREALRWMHDPPPMSDGWGRRYGPGDYEREQQTKCIRLEEELRTLMVGGVDPLDVAQKLAVEQEKWRKDFMSFRARPLTPSV